MKLEVIGDKSGLTFLGFAKQKLRQLSALREGLGLSELHRTYVVNAGSCRVFVQSARYGDLIQIETATTGIFYLVAVDGETLYGMDWSSLYSSGLFYKAKEIDLYKIAALKVSDYCPDKKIIVVNTLGSVYKKFKNEGSVGLNIDQTIPLYRNSALLFTNENGLFLTDGTATSKLYPGNDFFLGREEGFPVVSKLPSDESTWNRVHTIETYPVFDEEQAAIRAWVPKIFVGLPSSGFGIGEFVYGTRDDWDEYIKVVYAGTFIDATRTEEFTNTGVAEILWELGVGNDPIATMYCYTGLANDNATRNSFSDRTGFVGAQNQKYYNDQSGRFLGATCTYNLSSFLETESEYSIKHYGYFLGSRNHIVSIVVGETSKNFHVYCDGSFLSSGTYFWHSVGTNGDILAVGTEYGVLVLDCGDADAFDGSKRSEGEVVYRKIESENFASTKDGAVVPYFINEENFSLFDVTSFPEKPFPERSTIYDACLGGIEHLYPVGYASSISGWKVEIKQIGITLIAEGKRWVDECFENSSYTLLTKDGDSESYSVSVGGVKYESPDFSSLAGRLPYLLALFTDVTPKEIVLAEWSTGGSPRAVDAVGGAGVSVKKVERGPISILGPLIEGYGCGENAYEVSRNAKGPFVWDVSDGELRDCSGSVISGETGDRIVDVHLVPTCKDTITLSVEDSCGYSYDRDIPNPRSDLIVSGNSHATVGETYSASGGLGPYIFSFSAGSIDEETGEILSITACSAPNELRTGFVSAIDSCGAQAQKEVTLPGGVWVLVQADVPLETYDGSSPYCYCLETLVSGKTKEVITWGQYCSTVTCEMYGRSGTTCDKDTVYVGGIPDECGNPPLAGYSGSGTWNCYVDPGYTGDCGVIRYYPTPAFSVILGYLGYGRYSKNVFEWRCP